MMLSKTFSTKERDIEIEVSIWGKAHDNQGQEAEIKIRPTYPEGGGQADPGDKGSPLGKEKFVISLMLITEVSPTY